MQYVQSAIISNVNLTFQELSSHLWLMAVIVDNSAIAHAWVLNFCSVHLSFWNWHPSILSSTPFQHILICSPPFFPPVVFIFTNLIVVRNQNCSWCFCLDPSNSVINWGKTWRLHPTRSAHSGTWAISPVKVDSSAKLRPVLHLGPLH
jgi:hypothetical protein